VRGPSFRGRTALPWRSAVKFDVPAVRSCSPLGRSSEIVDACVLRTDGLFLTVGGVERDRRLRAVFDGVRDDSMRSEAAAFR